MALLFHSEGHMRKGEQAACEGLVRSRTSLRELGKQPASSLWNEADGLTRTEAHRGARLLAAVTSRLAAAALGPSSVGTPAPSLPLTCLLISLLTSRRSLFIGLHGKQKCKLH